MKIAVNRCFGGFSVSKDAALMLRSKGVKITLNGEYYSDGSGPCEKMEDAYYLCNEDFGIESDNVYQYRAEKRLIETIEILGEEKASGVLSNIVIVNIPENVDWEIDDYDGMENIEEVHRRW